MPSPRSCRHCRSRCCVCDVKICNCARCGKELTSDRSALIRLHTERLLGARRLRRFSLLAGHYDGRPYCAECLPIDRDPAEVAVHFHSCRTPRQQAKFGSMCG